MSWDCQWAVMECGMRFNVVPITSLQRYPFVEERITHWRHQLPICRFGLGMVIKILQLRWSVPVLLSKHWEMPEGIRNIQKSKGEVTIAGKMLLLRRNYGNGSTVRTDEPQALDLIRLRWTWKAGPYTWIHLCWGGSTQN